MKNFFKKPKSSTHKQYEALRALFVENRSIKEVSKQFSYTISSLYSLIHDFKKNLKKGLVNEYFFTLHKKGRKLKDFSGEIQNIIVDFRKKYLSVQEIKSILDSNNVNVSEKYIYNVIHKEGFSRLPRRSKEIKRKINSDLPIVSSQAILLKNKKETFNTQNIGILSFLPYISKYGIDKLIGVSQYPETTTLPKINSILSFLALKLSNIKRYTSDDLWCMDRGLGFFAGLNVLPKAAWFSSYSHRVTSDMNIAFLKDLSILWKKLGLVSDTCNLDFTSIPYWGNSSHLENNWSGKRNQALSSMLAVLGHDQDTGIITYGDANVRHKNESNIALEFLDFYKPSENLKYLVFDSKFTTYQNLRKIDDAGVKFITIRRRGKSIISKLDGSLAIRTRVETASGNRIIKVIDEKVFIKGYGKEIRQLAIVGSNRIKPALIITNDFDLPRERIVRKYARRWLVEKIISEHIHFFHLNRVSSSMVIKVDFDLTMTILSHNLYRLLAMDLVGYEKSESNALYEKFIYNDGVVEIDKKIKVLMKKKRNLPAILTAMNRYKNIKISWLKNFSLEIFGASYS